MECESSFFRDVGVSVRVKMRCPRRVEAYRMVFYLLYRSRQARWNRLAARKPCGHFPFASKRASGHDHTSLFVGGRLAPHPFGDTHPPGGASRIEIKNPISVHPVLITYSAVGLPQMKQSKNHTTRDRDSVQPLVRIRRAWHRGASESKNKAYFRRHAFLVFSGLSSPRKSQNGPVKKSKYGRHVRLQITTNLEGHLREEVRVGESLYR